MTIQTRINDGINTKTRTYRNVFKTVNLAQYREGFYAQREHSRYGIMSQLKGKERIVIATFGKLENGETLTGAIANRMINREISREI